MKKNKSRSMQLEPFCLWFSCQFFVHNRHKVLHCCRYTRFPSACVHSLCLLQENVHACERAHGHTHVHSPGATAIATSCAVLLVASRFSFSRIIFHYVCACVRLCMWYSSFHCFKKSKCILWLLFSLCFSFIHLTDTFLTVL